MGKTALITGATSGIGKATAEALAREGWELILCGRRQDRLDEQVKELGGLTKVHSLRFDIAQREEVESAINSIPEEFRNIDVLINNAGNAHGLDAIHRGNPDDWEKMMDINVKGLLYMTRLIAPGMVERRKGHIINIGSIAGKEVYPSGNVYCASKFAVDALTEGTRKDLNPYGIKVTGIHPGLVQTEFSVVRFKGDESKASKVYEGYQPLKARDIAETILFVISRPAHVNIADLLILPTDQASSTIVKKELRQEA